MSRFNASSSEDQCIQFRLMWPEKEMTNAWIRLPEQETTDLAGRRKHAAEYLKAIEEVVPHPKRPKSSSSPNEWLSEFNGPAGPLGLKLDKSPAALERFQKELNKNNGSLPSQNLQVGNKKDLKARVGASVPIDNLKASNFPALFLRIGNWEYVAKYEDDLRVKCYFSKHRLVWEVLYGRVKNKIEIQWEDIKSLKAYFQENGPDTLIVTVGKEPLFYKENNPQPGKHPVWHLTSDFTGGEAGISSLHYIQCAQGVLEKHYEKLINCDTRLKLISQRCDIVLEKPLPEPSVKAPNISHNIVSNTPEMSHMVLQPTSQCLLKDASCSEKDILKNETNGLHDESYYSTLERIIPEHLLMDPNSFETYVGEDHLNYWHDGNHYSSLERYMSFSLSQSLIRDANFFETDATVDNVNGLQDGNYYSSPEEMISSSHSQPLLKDANSSPDATQVDVSGWKDGHKYFSIPSDEDIYGQCLDESYGNGFEHE